MPTTMLLLGGATAVFAAVFVAAFSLESAVLERRRAYRTIRSLRAVELPAADIRSRDLALPASERVARPLYRGLVRVACRVTPVGGRERLARRLLLAGSPAGWDADRVLATKVGGLAAGAAGAAALLLGLHGSLAPRAAGAAALCLLGWFAPNVVLANLIQRRQSLIRLALPDSVDLLTISVEAGLGFDAALAHVARNTTGPLSQELYRTLQEVQLGRGRGEAMRHLAARSNVAELGAFVLAMVQADIFGVSIANVLRVQSTQMRLKRRQLAEERAMKVPIKVLFPVLFCIFPALFVVVLGPAAMRIAQAFGS
jgi:tight adherence protein C